MAVGDEVDPQQAGVGVGSVEGLEAVAELVLHRQAGQPIAQVLFRMGKTGKNGITGVLGKNQCCANWARGLFGGIIGRDKDLVDIVIRFSVTFLD